MSIETEAVPINRIDGTKPVTDVKANKKKTVDIGNDTFRWTVGLIVFAWVALFLLIYSLRKYNI